MVFGYVFKTRKCKLERANFIIIPNRDASNLVSNVYFIKTIIQKKRSAEKPQVV